MPLHPYNHIIRYADGTGVIIQRLLVFLALYVPGKVIRLD